MAITGGDTKDQKEPGSCRKIDCIGSLSVMKTIKFLSSLTPRTTQAGKEKSTKHTQN